MLYKSYIVIVVVFVVVTTNYFGIYSDVVMVKMCLEYYIMWMSDDYWSVDLRLGTASATVTYAQKLSLTFKCILLWGNPR